MGSASEDRVVVAGVFAAVADGRDPGDGFVGRQEPHKRDPSRALCRQGCRGVPVTFLSTHAEFIQSVLNLQNQMPRKPWNGISAVETLPERRLQLLKANTCVC